MYLFTVRLIFYQLEKRLRKMYSSVILFGQRPSAKQFLLLFNQKTDLSEILMN